MTTSITKTQRWLDLITFPVGRRLAIDPLTRVASLPNSPFRDATRSALRKLAFDLPVDALTTAPVLFVAPCGEEGLRVRVRALLATYDDLVRRTAEVYSDDRAAEGA